MKLAKKILMVVGSLIGVVVLLYVANAIYIFSSINGPALDTESKAWVDTITPQILESWDSNLLIQNASSEWLHSVTTEQTKEFTDSARQEFGTLIKYATSTGEAGVNINNFTSIITAEYEVDADFTKGPARIFVKGIKEDNEWKIFLFHVDRNPNLHWVNEQLTDQPELKNVGDSQVINGVHYKKLLSW